MTPTPTVSLLDLQDRLNAASATLAACPTLRDASTLSDIAFHHLLVQRRFISLAFTPLYDAIIDALHHDGARMICRQVLREEYPDEGGNTASHRELLVDDLVSLGITKRRLLAERPTRATVGSISESFELVVTASAEQHHDVALIATVACYAEALVSAEYRSLAPRIEKVLPLGATVFYGPHLLHDAGHAKRLLEEARVMLEQAPGQVPAFDAAVERCVRVKLRFYQQFESRVDEPSPEGGRSEREGAGPAGDS